MSSLETRITRLLRWYPRAWRDANGAVLRGTLLDAAEGEGRRTVRATEAWSIRLTGLGERLTVGVGAVLAVSALLVALVAQLSAFASSSPIFVIGAAGLAPFLLTAAMLSAPRALRVLSPIRTVGTLGLAAMAWALAAIARWSWSTGFTEADAGMAPSALSAAFVPITLTAWVFGGIAVAVATSGIAARLPRVLRWLSAIVAAVAVPPIAGFALLAPASPMLFAGVTALACMIVGARAQGASAPRPARAVVHRTVRRSTAAFAAVAIAFGVAGIAIAFSAHLWLPGTDGTRAMQLGVAIGHLAAVPLLGAFAWALGSRLPDRRIEVGVGAALMAVGLLALAALTFAGSTANGDLPWGALLPVAAGAGVLAAASLPLRLLTRYGCAAVVGMALFVPVWGFTAMALFLVPPAAVAMGLWGVLSGRPPRAHRTLQTG